MSADPENMTQYDWFSQARIYETMGNDEKALQAYEESIRLDPRYAKAWFHKAKLHYRLDQIDLARDCVKHVLELEPDWESYIKKYLPGL
ncbi:MAG: tetratricopeptide repeat protein [Candidatus Odinarchaeota archaeon]